jgi:hypothetical protein
MTGTSGYGKLRSFPAIPLCIGSNTGKKGNSHTGKRRNVYKMIIVMLEISKGHQELLQIIREKGIKRGCQLNNPRPNAPG